MNGIISLLTDFGEKGQHYVASMKAVILSINQQATIIDLSHSISSYSIIETQYIINSTCQYFPKGTIFVIVIDPGVGSSREILALKTVHEKYFVGPNNGIFTSILSNEIVKCVKVQNEKFFNHPVSKTFHGRDIMAPIGAYLSKGVSLDDFGPDFEIEKIIKELLTLEINQFQKTIKCTVQYIDNFGNITTNIPLTDDNIIYNTSLLIKEKDSITLIQMDENFYGKFNTHYGELSKDELFFMKGSTNFLEISKNQNNAAKDLNINSGDIITIVL